MAQGDLDIQSLRKSLVTRVIGCNLRYYDSVNSTMDEARREAEAGAPEGTVVVAEEQTAGRGRFQRTWVSPKGLNLLFSVLLRPRPEQLNRLNMAASLSVARAITNLTGLSPTIKWPNDVRINGRKTCGILIESILENGRVKHAVVGIGVNVNLDPAQVPEIATIATSMLRETGRAWPRWLVLKAILEEFDSLYMAIQRGSSLKEEWAMLLDTLGTYVQVRWGDQTHEGFAQGVDDDGNLVLTRPDGSSLTVVAGEVTLQE